MRRTLLLLVFAAVALAPVAFAAKPKLKDVLDPAIVPLIPYAWPEWRKLPREKRMETRGIDPGAWETPPPDPLTRKQAKFNALANGLPPSSLAGVIAKLTLIDKLETKYEKLIAERTEEYLKWKELLDRETKQKSDRYFKKHGKWPEQVMVDRKVLTSYRRGRKKLQRMLSVQESERQFRDWLPGRIAELIEELPEKDQGKPLAAIAKGLKHKDWRQRIRCVAILGRLHGEPAQALFDAALASEADPFVLAELIRIRSRARPDGVFALLRARLKDERWQVRAAVIAELGRLPKKESIEILIAQLEAESGRMKDDVVDALEALTTRRFEPDPAPWKQWWQKNKPTWKPPEKKAASGLAAKPGEEGKTVSFYGIPTSSKRIVFCLDVSGSMAFPLDGKDGKKKPRIETARAEMIRALRRLPADAMFTIVTYHTTVHVWKKKLVPASASNKKLAVKYVERMEPNGSTNIFDALNTSLRLAAGTRGKGKVPNADTIFFMTDGMPTDGRIVDPSQIITEITARNRHAGVVIHTIGVSKEQNAGFLLNLARTNGGKYAARK